MRFSTIVAAASLVASVSAGSLYSRQSQIPSCAGPCLIDVAQKVSSCNLQDNTCLCKDEKFVAASTQCIADNCQGDDLKNAIAASQSLCRAFGVTLTGAIPTPHPSSASETATGASTTPTSPASSGSGSGTAATSAPAATQTGGALTNTVSGALAGLVAVGVVALSL